MSLVVVTGGERRVSSGQPRPMRQSRPGPRVLILPTFDPPVSTSQQTLQATLLQNVFMNPVTYLLGLWNSSRFLKQWTAAAYMQWSSSSDTKTTLPNTKAVSCTGVIRVLAISASSSLADILDGWLIVSCVSVKRIFTLRQDSRIELMEFKSLKLCCHKLIRQEKWNVHLRRDHGFKRKQYVL